MKTIMTRMRHAIIGSGYTPVRLAKEINEKFGNKFISSQAIAQWMNDETKSIKTPVLFAAADILGYEPRWIATGKGNKLASSPEIPKDISEKLMWVYTHTDDQGRKILDVSISAAMSLVKISHDKDTK